MKTVFRILSLFALSFTLAGGVEAQLADGQFTGVSVTSTGATGPTLYGEFGTGKGSTLTLAGWSTTGYNFVFLPSTYDGSSSTTPAEQPGQYNNTFVFGPDNGGTAAMNGVATPPGGGNYVGSDGGFETAPISQQFTSLTVGDIYRINFYWAAAQQTGYTGATTEQWTVSLQPTTQAAPVNPPPSTGPALSTPTFSLPSNKFSGWMNGVTSTGGNFDFKATSAQETLYFLAYGTPNTEPPFSMLADVTMTVVPEPSAWLLLMVGGSVLTLCAILRRRAARGAVLTRIAGVNLHEQDCRRGPFVTRHPSVLVVCAATGKGKSNPIWKRLEKLDPEKREDQGSRLGGLPPA